ncbi:oligosaccharide flippase family protein [Pleomorphomonas koreensis]|uniref:oligosaccharide flippase family protein n=1 Tax=Pleomorphomonas koreensis TaxID=257440 RepID=UPI00146E58AD|nr:oligosaccharide flippase family protein [Pleomorphomonas koreensis]
MPQIKSSRNSLKKNTIWMMAGNTYYSLCQWLVLVIIARFGGTKDVGVFTLGLAITTPVVMFFALGMRTILATDTRQERDFSAYFLVKTITSIGVLVVCFGIALWFSQGKWLVIFIVAISKTIESISDMCYGYAQQDQRLDRVAISLIVRGTLSTSLLAIIYMETNDLAASVCAYTASWLFILFIYDRKNLPETPLHFDKQVAAGMRSLFQIGLPLGITGLMGLLGPNIPRYVLENAYGAEALGVFSGMAYFITIGNIPVMALGQSLVPILANYHEKKEHKSFFSLVLKALASILVMGLLGIAAAYLLGAFVLNLVYGPEFATRADVLPLIAIAAAIGYLGNILGYTVSAAKIYIAQAPAFAFVALTSLCCALVLIPRFGVEGAAYTMVLNSLMSLLAPILLLFIYRKRKIA